MDNNNALTDRPNSLQPVVQCGFQSIRIRMPDLNSSILGTGDDDRQLRMEGHCGNVLCMPFQGLDTGFILVIPYLNKTIVCSRDKIRFISSVIVINTVNSLLVSLEGKVRSSRTQLPDLHSLIQGGGGEGVVILRVDPHLHHVVGVSLKHLLAQPSLLPVPQFYQHVVLNHLKSDFILG